MTKTERFGNSLKVVFFKQFVIFCLGYKLTVKAIEGVKDERKKSSFMSPL